MYVDLQNNARVGEQKVLCFVVKEKMTLHRLLV